jgi:hypothetical protein
VLVEINPAAAEGVTHPESLRQKDRNTQATSWEYTLESVIARSPPKGQRLAGLIQIGTP